MTDRAQATLAQRTAVGRVEARACEVSERLIAQTDHAQGIETRLREQTIPLRTLEAKIRVRERTWEQRAAHFLSRVARRGSR